MTQALLFSAPTKWADLEQLQARYGRPSPDSEPPDPELVVALDELKRLREIAALARRMRIAQVTYFTSRTPKALKEAKALEAQLDDGLKEELP